MPPQDDVTPCGSPTAYGEMTRGQARVALITLLALSAISIGAALTSSGGAQSDGSVSGHDRGDIALHRSIIERIREGQGYYEATAEQLAARNYPTGSVFNWRPPLPIWLLAQLPHPLWGRAILSVVVLAIVVLGFEAMSRDAPRNRQRPLACAVLLACSLFPVLVSGVYVWPTFWAGAFLALSVCAYGVNWRWMGVAAGLAALFFRELTLPYCALAILLAWRSGRKREIAAWGIGLACWGVWYGLHVLQVLEHMPPDAKHHPGGWVRFGGLPFILSTVQVNGSLILLPRVVSAVYFVAAVVGLGGWRSPWGIRTGATAAIYLLLFACVGLEGNSYWGFLIAPLLCFGVARCPASMSDLWRRAIAA